MNVLHKWIEQYIRTRQTIEGLECIGSQIKADVEDGHEYTLDAEAMAAIRKAYAEQMAHVKQET